MHANIEERLCWHDLLLLFLGTSNWSAEYFLNTAGVGLVISQRSPPDAWAPDALQSQLGSLFDRDWNSEFAVALANLGHHEDCALATGRK